MLFEFIKYINPTWYFNLVPAGHSIPYFVDYRKLSREEHDLLAIDNGYKTFEGKLADAAYQAWQKGIMKREPEHSIFDSSQFQKPGRQRAIKLFKGHSVNVKDDVFVTSVIDNYRFIRRFFNPVMVWYILAVRLLSLFNPLKELNGFFRSLKIERVDLYKKNSLLLFKDDYDNYNSPLVTQQPKVSVIIPTLNRYAYLKDVLIDLEKQDYKNFEVIVCDQSDRFDEGFYKDWKLQLKLIRQEEKALWLARNNSIKASSGEFIAFSEDDVRINHDWLSQHLKCIDFFKSDISAGVFFPAGSDIPFSKNFFKWADQFATGNALIKKEIFTATGLFDQQYEKQRSGDGEFGLRCYLLGFKSISNPLAFCIDVKASTGGLREKGSWDSFRPINIFAPRPVPSVLYLARKYFGNHFARLMLLFTIPGSIVPYKYKSKKWLKILTGVAVIFLWPFLIVQVSLSWSRATEKLKAGPLIEKNLK